MTEEQKNFLKEQMAIMKRLYTDMLFDVPYGKSAEYVLRWNDWQNDMLDAFDLWWEEMG